ncbi:MAG: hypothetical protein EOM69_11825 [Clostridia bacterium]|nr:hypothetical protein [Clostridia bacterium]
MISKLVKEPVFCPIVADFFSGMAVSVPFVSELLLEKLSAAELASFFAEYYKGRKMMKVLPYTAEGITGGFIASNALSGYDGMQIIIAGNDDRFTVTARFDNLGKGASGAAVQCLNIMIGKEEDYGLKA